MKINPSADHGALLTRAIGWETPPDRRGPDSRTRNSTYPRIPRRTAFGDPSDPSASGGLDCRAALRIATSNNAPSCRAECFHVHRRTGGYGPARWCSGRQPTRSHSSRRSATNRARPHSPANVCGFWYRPSHKRSQVDLVDQGRHALGGCDSAGRAKLLYSLSC